jgi:UDP-4-amino-4,6-dideoxy-N-acetyl-beta-L-altrosamine N-acetyltransferase
MYQSDPISVSEHLAFVGSLQNDKTKQFFAVLEGETPVGAIIFSRIDLTNRCTDWAFYTSPEAVKGLGSVLEIAALTYAFEHLQMEKLHCEVLEPNERVIRMHQRFGFKIEGRRSAAIERTGRRIDYILLGFTRGDWNASHTTLRESTYQRVPGVRVIREESVDSDVQNDLIGQIQQARAQNNVNWMNILRIALEKSPSSAALIVQDITKLDGRIQALSAELGITSSAAGET